MADLRAINIEQHHWYTYCLTCERRYIIHDHRPIGDPDQADEFRLTCICGSDVRGWDEGS